MNKQTFSSFLVFFLMVNTVLYSQSNQATKFELTDTNAFSIATQVHQLLRDSAEYPGFPDVPRLQRFFEDPFNAPNVTFNTSACAQPGLRAYENGQGQICFRFDQVANLTNGNLVIGNLDYSDSNFPTAYVIHGQGMNGGIDLPEQNVHCQIFVVGYLCPSTGSGGQQLANKFEILIVDKNIL